MLFLNDCTIFVIICKISFRFWNFPFLREKNPVRSFTFLIKVNVRGYLRIEKAIFRRFIDAKVLFKITFQSQKKHPQVKSCKSEMNSILFTVHWFLMNKEKPNYDDFARLNRIAYIQCYTHSHGLDQFHIINMADLLIM